MRPAGPAFRPCFCMMLPPSREGEEEKEDEGERKERLREVEEEFVLGNTMMSKKGIRGLKELLMDA